MQYLNSLELKFFQSHKHTILDFTPGVNTIVGPTDNGKSAIIRAFKWLTTNRPSGEEFRSNFAVDEETKVTLKTDTYELRRGRGKDGNYYWQNGIRYVSFGQDVPEPIKEILNLEELNFQLQHNPPFLFAESPGAVARYLNQIVNIDVIDESLKNINTLLRKVDNKLANTKTKLEELNNEIATYPDFVTLDKQIAILEGWQKIIQENDMKIYLLSNTITDIKATQDKVETINIPKIDTAHLTNLLQKYIKLQSTTTELTTLIEQIKLTKTKLASIVIPKIDIGVMDNLLKQHKQSSRKIVDISSLISSLSKVKLTVQQLRTEIDKWEKIYLEKFPQVCPLCQQQVSYNLLRNQLDVAGVT